MIKLNDTQATSLNVLAESDLESVVGGCYHGRRRGWGDKKWGDYDKGGYGKGYDKGYDKRHDDYEPSYDDYEGSSSAVAVNNVDLEINIAINQVAG